MANLSSLLLGCTLALSVMARKEYTITRGSLDNDYKVFFEIDGMGENNTEFKIQAFKGDATRFELNGLDEDPEFTGKFKVYGVGETGTKDTTCQLHREGTGDLAEATFISHSGSDFQENRGVLGGVSIKCGLVEAETLLD